MLIVNLLLLIVGFGALIKGADMFVDGSSGLAENFKVPKVIIGLTIVAMGTSAPELAVSTSAALQGANEIALSNVVGSNIFNLLCVLGICAVIHPVPVEKIILKFLTYNSTYRCSHDHGIKGQEKEGYRLDTYRLCFLR